MAWPHQILWQRAAQGVVAALAAAFVLGVVVLVARGPDAPPMPTPPERPAAAAEAEASPRLNPSALKVVWEGLDPRPAAEPPKPAPAPVAARPVPSPADAPDIKLCGVIFSTAGDSVAFLQLKDKVVPVRAGQEADGWTVASIGTVSVTLARGEQRCVLVMKAEYGEHATPAEAAGPAETTVAVETPGRGRDAASGKAAMRATHTVPASAPPPPLAGADTRVAVSKGVVDQYRDNPARALVEQDMQIEPEFRDGKMAGLVLRKAPPGSLAAAHGLAAGDRILAVNGQPIDSPARVLELYNQHKNSDQVRVTIERGGQRREVLFYAR